MSGKGAGDEGAISDVPWALVFDPAINVRALGEIQARGFRAAADLVDRFVKIADSNPAAATVADGVESDRRETGPGTETSRTSSGCWIPGRASSARWPGHFAVRLRRNGQVWRRSTSSPRTPAVRSMCGQRRRAWHPRRCGCTTVGQQIGAPWYCDAVICCPTMAASSARQTFGSIPTLCRCPHVAAAVCRCTLRSTTTSRPGGITARCWSTVIPTSGCR